MAYPIVISAGAILVLLLAFIGYKRTGSPSALISGSIGAALILLGMAITWTGQSRWMTVLPCVIVTLAFAARGTVSAKKKAPAAALIFTIAVVAALTGVAALFVPLMP